MFSSTIQQQLPPSAVISPSTGANNTTSAHSCAFKNAQVQPYFGRIWSGIVDVMKSLKNFFSRAKTSTQNNAVIVEALTKHLENSQLFAQLLDPTTSTSVIKSAVQEWVNTLSPREKTEIFNKGPEHVSDLVLERVKANPDKLITSLASHIIKHNTGKILQKAPAFFKNFLQKKAGKLTEIGAEKLLDIAVVKEKLREFVNMLGSKNISQDSPNIIIDSIQQLASNQIKKSAHEFVSSPEFYNLMASSAGILGALGWTVLQNIAANNPLSQAVKNYFLAEDWGKDMFNNDVSNNDFGLTAPEEFYDAVSEQNDAIEQNNSYYGLLLNPKKWFGNMAI